MTPENEQAIRAAVTEAMSNLTAEDIRELTMEPYRSITAPA